MVSFAFLLLPVCLVWYCFYLKKARITPAIIIGVIASVLLSLFLAVFTFSHRIPPYNFAKNFIYLSLTQTVLPSVILFLLYAIISRDDLSVKAEAFFPLELSFFSIYLPYIIITTSDGRYNSFQIFRKPVLFLVMIFLASFSIKKISAYFISKKIVVAVLFIILFFISLLIPPLFETIYIM